MDYNSFKNQKIQCGDTYPIIKEGTMVWAKITDDDGDNSGVITGKVVGKYVVNEGKGLVIYYIVEETDSDYEWLIKKHLVRPAKS